RARSVRSRRDARRFGAGSFALPGDRARRGRAAGADRDADARLGRRRHRAAAEARARPLDRSGHRRSAASGGARRVHRVLRAQPVRPEPALRRRRANAHRSRGARAAAALHHAQTARVRRSGARAGRHSRALRARARRRQPAGAEAERGAAHALRGARGRPCRARASRRRPEPGSPRGARGGLQVRVGDVRLLQGARRRRRAARPSSRAAGRAFAAPGRVKAISAQSRVMRSVALLLLCSLCTVAAHAALPPEIERVLAGHSIPADAVSIVVQPVDSAEPILSHLPDVARNPASVMKTVTTWAGLEILGPAYQWRTEAYFLGDFDGSRLDGDLALKGYGDPYLVLEELWKLLRSLRRTGLQEIRGDLVLDDTYFDVR